MPNDHLPASRLLADHPDCADDAGLPHKGEARQRALLLLREALRILDEELDEDVVGAKLSECIERLAEPDQATPAAAAEYR